MSNYRHITLSLLQLKNLQSEFLHSCNPTHWNDTSCTVVPGHISFAEICEGPSSSLLKRHIIGTPPIQFDIPRSRMHLCDQVSRSLAEIRSSLCRSRNEPGKNCYIHLFLVYLNRPLPETGTEAWVFAPLVRHRLAADIFYLHGDFRHCKSFPLCSVSLYRSCSTLVQYMRPITTLDF